MTNIRGKPKKKYSKSPAQPLAYETSFGFPRGSTGFVDSDAVGLGVEELSPATLTGVVEIGDGINTFGHYDMANYASARQLFLAAFASGSKDYAILAGVYPFSDGYVENADEGLTIYASKGAEFEVRHTGEIGTFHITGDHARFAGGRFISYVDAPGQDVLRMESGKHMTCRDVFLQFTVKGTHQLDNANPDLYMTGIAMKAALGHHLEDCVCIPELGVRAFYGENGDAPRWSNLEVRSPDERKPSTGADYQECSLPFHMKGTQMGNVENLLAYGLGSTSNYMLEVFRYDYNPDYLIGDPPVPGEQGHLDFIDPKMEACYTRRYVSWYGGRFIRMTDGMFGQNESSTIEFDQNDWENGHAAIYVDSSDQTDTGQLVLDFTMLGVGIHNAAAAGSPAPFIAIQRAQRVVLNALTIGLAASEYTILFNGDNIGNDITMIACTFDGDGTAKRPYFIRQVNPISKCDRIIAMANKSDGYIEGWEPSKGVWGPYFPTGLEYDSDPTLTYTATTLAFESNFGSGTGIKINDSANGLGFLQVGDIVEIDDAPDTQNLGIQVVESVTPGQVIFKQEIVNITGLGDVPQNDFADTLAGDPVTIRVFPRNVKLNTNMPQK